MANRTTSPLKHRRTEMELVTFELKGTGATAPTINDATQPGGSECTLATRPAGAGAYTLTIRRAWPQIVDAEVNVIGTTAALRGKFTAKPVLTATGSTVTIQLDVAGVATDAASGDLIIVKMLVRNSGRN